MLVVVAAYLLGSVDFAVLVARAKGVDIYSVGSGNPGTANVLRTVGRGAAAMVMAGDLLKGVVAAAAGQLITGDIVVGYAAGAAAVLGHCFPIWHRFKGGKGVATGAGMILWLAWPAFIVVVVVWVAVVALTRISSIASVTGAILVVPALLLVQPPPAAYAITGRWPCWWSFVTFPTCGGCSAARRARWRPSRPAVEEGVEPGTG